MDWRMNESVGRKSAENRLNAIAPGGVWEHHRRARSGVVQYCLALSIFSASIRATACTSALVDTCAPPTRHQL